MAQPDPKKVARRKMDATRTKTAGEIRFIKDQGANHGKASWGWEDYRMSPPQKRHITSDFDFKVHRVPTLARVLRSTVASLGHAMKGYETFCKLKSADISPDGALGGRGYIMKISDMRRQYVNVLEALSTMSDTFDDEIRAPHWKVLMARNPSKGEEVQDIVDDAHQIKEDPEAWAAEQEQEMDVEKDEDGKSAIPRVASTNREHRMRVSIANRYLESLDRERLRDE